MPDAWFPRLVTRYSLCVCTACEQYWSVILFSMDKATFYSDVLSACPAALALFRDPTRVFTIPAYLLGVMVAQPSLVSDDMDGVEECWSGVP